MTTTTHTITTKQFPSLFYRRTGEGPALMLMHGFPASGSLWDGMAAGLSSNYTLLIPDLPGAGSSRLEGETVGMEDLATVVPAILDDAGIACCVLAGHSMGGYVSMAAAELFPQRLSGLLLIHSSASADDEAKKEKRAKSITLIRKGGREEFVKGMIPALFSESFRNEQPEAVKRMIAEGMKLPAQSAVAFYGAMMNRPDRTAILKNLTIPVGWVSGRDDATIPWQSTLQQSTFPCVSFVALCERCAHMSMIEQPDLLTFHMLRFSEYCMQRSEAFLK